MPRLNICFEKNIFFHRDSTEKTLIVKKSHKSFLELTFFSIYFQHNKFFVICQDTLYFNGSCHVKFNFCYPPYIRYMWYIQAEYYLCEVINALRWLFLIESLHRYLLPLLNPFFSLHICKYNDKTKFVTYLNFFLFWFEWRFLINVVV